MHARGQEPLQRARAFYMQRSARSRNCSRRCITMVTRPRVHKVRSARSIAIINYNNINIGKRPCGAARNIYRGLGVATIGLFIELLLYIILLLYISLGSRPPGPCRVPDPVRYMRYTMRMRSKAHVATRRVRLHIRCLQLRPEYLL